METLQVIWFIIIGIMLMLYAVLDGFDLGIGALTPLLAKDDSEIKQLYTSIGPVWDGNEVFIIAGGALLFAAFPHVYATVFSGFYLALMLLLFALIFRAVSLEFWSLDNSNRSIWKWSFTVSSLLISILYGVALGNVIVGIPLDGARQFTGSFFTLLRPFPLSIGLLGLSAILLQGITYAALKTDKEVRKRACELVPKIVIIYFVTLGLAFLATLFFMKDGFSSILPWVFSGTCVGSLVMCKKMIVKKNYKTAFILSTVSFASLWGITGSLLFPNLVRSVDPVYNLTIYNSSSSEMTLTAMLIIVTIGLPLVAVYMRFVYRTFRGTISK